jgi:TonB family protein
LALNLPGNAADTDACNAGDTAAILAKFRQYTLPAPDSPQHRWIVSQATEGWRITEYSGLRVLARCKAMSKADELNGVHRGEVEFQYDASRTTQLPGLTSAGLQWSEWSEWTDSLKPLGKAQEEELDPTMKVLYRLAVAADTRDRRIPFRKSQAKFQFEWEYDEASLHPTLMAAADVSRFFDTADSEAAKLRVAEAKQPKPGQEESAPASDAQRWATPAKITRPANPDDYYPPGSMRREEQGSPVVQACIGPKGQLLREPVITDTSGFPELDMAAVKIAKATRYAAGTDEQGTAIPESCIKFKVKFALDNN